MKLIVMRHGEAEGHNKADELRNLTRFGRTQAAFTGRRLCEYLQNDFHKPTIDLALVSPYSRAQQTFEELSKQISVSKKIDTDLIIPSGSVDQASDFIHGIALDEMSPENLLLVSHMPFVSLLADKFCKGFNARIFSTADILIIEYDPESQNGEQLALIQSID